MSKDLNSNKIPPDVLQRASFLVQEIVRHDDLYYGQNSPEIDDFEYDLLLRELFTLEKIFPQLQSMDSPTQTLTHRAFENFPTYQRKIPMLSLSNALNLEEALKFWKSFPSSWGALDFFVSPKFDGIAIELIYKKGKLFLAATRGNGFVGEDITLNIKNITCIIKKLPILDTISIRGELVLSKQEFFKLNLQKAQLGLPLLANSRNAVAGMVRVIDYLSLQKTNFLFFPYALLGESVSHFNKHSQRMSLLKTWGFSFSQFEENCQSFEQIQQVFQTILEKRDSLDFNLDGMVILSDSYEVHKDLGESGKYPRYAIAWKFPPQIQQTKILNVTWNVGSRGNLTPVAQVEPVVVSEASVKRVTLHNIEYLIKKDIRIGDWVQIIRSGDVIPRILDVILDKRSRDVEFIPIPQQCLDCDSPIFEEIHNLRLDFFCPSEEAHTSCQKGVFFFKNFLLQITKCLDVTCVTKSYPSQLRFKIVEEENRYWAYVACIICNTITSEKIEVFPDVRSQNLSYNELSRCLTANFSEKREIRYSFNPSLLCINKNCEGVLFAKLKVFCGKSGLDIRGLGKSQLKLLLQNKIIQKPSDLYQIEKKHLQHLPGFGEKKISNIINSILSSKKQSCKKLLCALNIPAIETVTAEKISRELAQLPTLPQTPKDFLQALYNLACSPEYLDKEIGKNIKFFVTDEDSSAEFLSILLQIDLQNHTFFEPQFFTKDTPISGKVLVFTGTLQMPRHIIRERAEKLGAITASSITSSTKLLVVGENPGNKKIQKAQELEIPIINERDFLQLIQQFL